MKSALYFIYSAYLFRVAAAQCKQICPERLNWPGRLAGISPSFLSQKSQSQHSIFQPAHRISSIWCAQLQSLIYFHKKHCCIIFKTFFFLIFRPTDTVIEVQVITPLTQPRQELHLQLWQPTRGLHCIEIPTNPTFTSKNNYWCFFYM